MPVQGDGHQASARLSRAQVSGPGGPSRPHLLNSQLGGRGVTVATSCSTLLGQGQVEPCWLHHSPCGAEGIPSQGVASSSPDRPRGGGAGRQAPHHSWCTAAGAGPAGSLSLGLQHQQQVCWRQRSLWGEPRRGSRDEHLRWLTALAARWGPLPDGRTSDSACVALSTSAAAFLLCTGPRWGS